jgi:hypothetical protein
MKKVLKWIGIIFLILLVLIITLPIIFKGKIVAKVKEEANKNLNAKVDFGDFSLSLIRSFPDFSLSMEKLSIINLAPFAGDTLIYAKDLDVTVDLMSVIKGEQIKIKSVKLDSPIMNFLVNKDGKTNWDITKPSAEPGKPSEPSQFKASLNSYVVKNGTILYSDVTMPFSVLLVNVNHTGKGDFTQDLFTLSTHTEGATVDLSYGGVKYLSSAKVSADADLEMDMKNSKYTFKDNKISLNDLDLGFSGWLAMPDTNIDMDLKFSAAKSDFKNFISLIPSVYSKDFKSVTASGKMAFDGWAKGRYNANSIPGFGLNLNIDNGAFKYSSMPSDVKNVFVDLKVNNPDGNNDHSIVNLSRFHMEMANNPFDAKLVLKTPVSDPDIDAMFKGKIDLNNVQQVVPLEKGTTLSGTITTDLTMKGKYSAAKKANLDGFSAGGNLNVADLNYSSSGLKKPVSLKTVNMTFNPKTVALNAFDMKAGNTDLKATGSLENFVAYAFNNEVIKGQLKLTSNKIDLNEWMSEDPNAAKKSADTAAMNVVQIPGNIDFTMSASIGTLIYENLSITNASGTIIIRDSAINMNDLVMHMMDGTMTMNGKYATPNPKKPDINFNMAIRDFNIQKTADAFPTVAKMAPIAKNSSGNFSSKMDVKGNLDEHLNAVIPSLNGSGTLNTSQITVAGFPATQKIADALKMEKLKKLDIPKTNISFKFTNGRVFVDPFDATMNGFAGTIAGSNGFDQTIDYVMNLKIPKDAFGGAAGSVLNNLVSSANSKGANFSVGDIIPVELKIGGTVLNPKVSTDLNKAGAKAMESLKAAAEAEYSKKKAEVESKAKEELDKKKAEADARVKEEKEKLQKEIDAKKKAAEDSTKKAAQQKAKDAIKDLNPFKKK